MHEDRWWTPLGDGSIRCDLCPRRCVIKPGKAGFCIVRRNEGGRLVDAGWGHPTGLAVDPIEKKPLYHFLPGSRILSFGTVGCNLGCRFCQNWHMSRSRDLRTDEPPLEPTEVVQAALASGSESIAFTYNDPIIFARYAIDVAQEARAKGLRSVAVTAGYVEPGPREDFFRAMDAANIDLKGFSEDFYRKWCRAELAPVLDTISWVVRETDCWVELTNLVIPGLNDDEATIRAMCEWIVRELGPDVPLHLSAFHPDAELRDRPRTPLATLEAARAWARDVGLRYVYVGNVHDPEGWVTRCHVCGEPVIRRGWFGVQELRLERDRCPSCGTRIPGVFLA